MDDVAKLAEYAKQINELAGVNSTERDAWLKQYFALAKQVSLSATEAAYGLMAK